MIIVALFLTALAYEEMTESILFSSSAFENKGKSTPLTEPATMPTIGILKQPLIKSANTWGP